MGTTTATDVRTVAYEREAAHARIVALRAQIDRAQEQDDLRAVRWLLPPLRDAQARYRNTSALLAAAAEQDAPVGVR